MLPIIKIIFSNTYVLGVHDVAALANGRDALMWVDHHRVGRRRHRPWFAVPSARVGRDGELNAVGYADLPRVTCQWDDKNII